MTTLEERISRERLHGQVILKSNESNWGWNTPAGAIRKKRRADFLSRHPGAGPAAVLEVGCGTGTFTGELAQAFSNLTAVDVSDVLLEAARGKWPSVRFENRDIHRTGFADNTFDWVVGCSVLHHLDWDLALMEIHRILKPGGQIRFSEPNLLNFQIFLQKNWPWLKKRLGDSPDEYAFTSWQVSRSLKHAGFREIEVRPYEFLHPSTPKALIQPLIRFENWLEKTPLSHFGGSLKISATK